MSEEGCELKIELRSNNVHIKQPCVVCDRWERPGEVAAFTDAGEWVCDMCLVSGEENVRRLLAEQAAKYRRVAASYEAAAQASIEGLVTREEFDQARAQEQARWEQWEAREPLPEEARLRGKTCNECGEPAVAEEYWEDPPGWNRTKVYKCEVHKSELPF